MAFESFTYYTIGPMPVIAYLGIIAYGTLFLTAVGGYLATKGKRFLSIKWHMRLAIMGIIIAGIHGFLAISTYI